MRSPNLTRETPDGVRRIQVTWMYWGLPLCTVFSWVLPNFDPRIIFPFLLGIFLLPPAIRWLDEQFITPRFFTGPTELEKLGESAKYIYPYLFLTEDGRTFLDRNWGPLYRRHNRNGRSKIWRDEGGLRLELLGSLAVLRFRADAIDEKELLEVTVVNLPEVAKSPPPQGELFLEVKSDGTASVMQLQKAGKS